ncbi:MAG: PorV/PorQ family protein [Bacteroidales bacterium]|nr:PorV/PorQ family protein [Bacteroidales bacterium]
MKKQTKNLLLITLMLLASGIASAQAPKYSNEFLSLGIGARSLAMSNTHISFVDDATAGYWNPAGLLNMSSDRQLSLMHAEYFAGIAKYDYGSFAIKFDEYSAGALSIIRFGVDDIPNTTELIDNQGNIDYNRITSFSAADYGILFSYARKMTNIEGLSIGGNVKVIRRIIGDFAGSWGFGLDAGIQYSYKKWHFGAMGRDITSTFNAWNYNLSDRMIEVFEATGNEIPTNSIELTLPKLIIGASRKFELPKNITALVAIDFDITTDGKRNTLIKSKPFSIDPHMGFELGYQNLFFIRGGVGNIQQESDFEKDKYWSFQFNLGLGVVIKKILTIDYAMSDIGDNSIAIYSNIFSLRLNINKPKEIPKPASF